MASPPRSILKQTEITQKKNDRTKIKFISNAPMTISPDEIKLKCEPSIHISSLVL